MSVDGWSQSIGHTAPAHVPGLISDQVSPTAQSVRLVVVSAPGPRVRPPATPGPPPGPPEPECDCLLTPGQLSTVRARGNIGQCVDTRGPGSVARLVT